MDIKKIAGIDTRKLKENGSGYFSEMYEIIADLQNRLHKFSSLSLKEQKELGKTYEDFTMLIGRLEKEWKEEAETNPHYVDSLKELQDFYQLLKAAL